MEKLLPKKHEKLTFEQFKFIRNGVVAYWSFKFGVDGYTENEFIIGPNGEHVKVCLYDNTQVPLFGAIDIISGKITKDEKTKVLTMSQKTIAKVMTAVNKLYDRFYQ